MADLLSQLKQIEKLRIAAINSGLEAFEANILRVQNNLMKAVINFLSDLKKPGGVISANIENIAIVIASNKKLNQELINAGYGELVEKYVAESNIVIENARKRLGIFGFKKPFTETDVKIIGLIKANMTDKFGVIGETAIDGIVDQLRQGVLGNSSYKTMVSNLTDSIIGTDVRGGLLRRYASVYAHDSIMELDQSVNLMAGNNFNAQHFLYSGPFDQVTRPFCQARVGKVFTKAEINGMQNDAGTDVWMTRGGWNCRHIWIPIAEELKDEFN